ncbi:DUF4184 family protein [Microbacterium kyungheense]|uniref:Uncharacterized protein DUF4184 n=1 Tax=Microbacterium kyungheense TaxID=1263636 RepID=A0A543FLV2_9MICO|nr:DUF4184 family protein [Microbacterium kyungheense]TQM34825.1 uncharacterized protein DUF4184 [Microbacterium kyungheense]
MPFTPSHAVVALPFIRTPLVPAAIAVGAMTPDLPLFVRGLPLAYGITHSFAWLPVTMAAAFALLLLWRCVVRPAARELSPRWIAERLPGEWDAGASASFGETLAGRPGARRSVIGVLLLVASLAIGVVSHIVWDLFTHEGRWGSSVLPGLAASWGPLPGYKWLQHGSSALGLAILGAFMLVWLIRRRVAASAARVLPRGIRAAWWLSLPIVLVVAWGAGFAAFGPFDDAFTPAHLAYRVLPPACATWGALTVALCVAVQVLRARSSREGSAGVSREA